MINSIAYFKNILPGLLTRQYLYFLFFYFSSVTFIYYFRLRLYKIIKGGGGDFCMMNAIKTIYQWKK